MDFEIRQAKRRARSARRHMEQNVREASVAMAVFFWTLWLLVLLL